MGIHIIGQIQECPLLDACRRVESHRPADFGDNQEANHLNLYPVPAPVGKNQIHSNNLNNGMKLVEK